MSLPLPDDPKPEQPAPIVLSPIEREALIAMVSARQAVEQRVSAVVQTLAKSRDIDPTKHVIQILDLDRGVIAFVPTVQPAEAK